MARVRVGGRWLHSFTKVDGLRWRHAADGGCLEAEWTVSLPPSTVAHPGLKPGALVEIFNGVSRVWFGRLGESGDSGTSCYARGLFDDSAGLLGPAVTGGASAMSDAINAAIANGWPVTYLNDAPAAIASESRDYLRDAMSVAATAAQQRVTVRADAVLRWEPVAPAAPAYQIAPGIGALSRTSEDYYTHVTVLYVSSVSGTPPTPDATAEAVASDALAASVFGRRDLYLDVRHRGLLTASKANSLATGVLKKVAARLSFTGTVAVNDRQIRTIGGQRVALPEVAAGSVVRFMGVQTPAALGLAAFDVVIGGTDYVDGSGQLTISPLGLAARTLSDVIASLPTSGTALQLTPGAGATR